MKRLSSLLAALLLLATTALPIVSARAEGTNLIQNPSAETVSGSGPANWTASRWGTNTATLSHSAQGNTGSKSLRIDMTAHTSGDAKWMHDAVAVTPSTSYTYTGFYKSNVATEIDLQYTTAAGAVSYAYAQYVAASADWTELTVTFTTPANAAKVRVMHIIASAGWLQTDDFSLVETVVAPPPADDNLIANASFETANGATPAGWSSNSWGTNTRQFTHENTGRTGSKSAKVAISSYTSGDAKWYAGPISITGGTTYAYSDYYKANTTTRVVAAFVDGSGTTSYAELASAPSSTDWAQYTTTFTAPATATKVSIYHLLSAVGNLTIDDVHLAEDDGTVTPPPHDHEDGENIIDNSSAEESAGTVPAHWQKNSWGTNTAQFTYTNSGRTGSKSLTTTITQYTSGDAKWLFDPVTIVAGKTYLYRDYYKSTTNTRVVVAYINSAGAYSYAEQKIAPANANWTQYETSFTVPAGAVKATVFHLIDSVGTLTIDDATLVVAAPSSPALVPNGSLEDAASTTLPVGWEHNSWGSNTANFQYMNEGRTGSKSVKVNVSNYTNGDAKWFFTPVQTLTPGKQYRFSTWYKSNVTAHAVALFVKADGTEQYVGMPKAIATSTTTWQQYTDTFSVPQDAVSVSVFLFVAQNGWLQTDDYSISEYHPTGFNRALVTLTFDDGHEDNATTALPLLNQYGFKSTQCYATSFVEGKQTAVNDVLAFYNSGHEICSHTVTHPFLSTLNSSNLQYELQHSKQYLESIVGVPVRNFASPYGDYNATVNDAIDNYYASHRTVDEGYNSKDNFNIYRLRVQNILDTTSAAQVRTWIEQAQADNTWLILVYHRVASNPGPYDSYTNVFAEHLAAIKATGITVKTYQGALDEVQPQL